MTGSRRRDDIGVDAIEEILSRLPVKDVIRCKLLSKTYEALITSQNFMKKHLLHRSMSTSNNIIVVTKTHVSGQDNNIVSLLPSLSPVYVPPIDNFTEVLYILMGGCNGLLCATFWGRNSQTFLIWNPAIREQFIILDDPTPHYDSAMGFGYDATSDDYKLVKILGFESAHQAHLWSRKTSSWKFIELESVLLKYRGNGMQIEYGFSGLLVGECLYWLASASDQNWRNHQTFLLSFDLVSDVFRVVNTLPNIAFELSQLCIIDLMGSLALSIRFPVDDISSRFIYEIWVMDEENKNSWTERFTIGPFTPQVWPTGISLNGKLVMSNAGDSNGCNYFLYDPSNKEQMELFGSYNPFFPPCNYTETLVLVNQRPATIARGSDAIEASIESVVS